MKAVFTFVLFAACMVAPVVWFFGWNHARVVLAIVCLIAGAIIGWGVNRYFSDKYGKVK